MYMRLFAGATLAILLSLSPVAAGTAKAQFFGPLIPEECHCEDQPNPDGGPSIQTAPDFGCVMQTIQNGINLAISLIGVLFVIAIVYAGAQLVLSGGNPQKLQPAKDRIASLLVGFVVFLGAWILVDFVMKTFYNDSGKFGPWNAILAPGETTGRCIVATKPTSIVSGLMEIVGGAPGTSNPGTGTGSGSGSCDAIPDNQLTTVGGFKLTHDTARRFNEMKAAAAKDGVNLIIVSGYRSPDDQLRAWNQNGCQLVNGRTQCRVRTAAVPCSLGGSGSNHTRGTAVDIRLNAGVYDWLKANASKFGFYNNLPNDLPHWSDTGR